MAEISTYKKLSKMTFLQGLLITITILQGLTNYLF